jgi:DNA polymerase elongation subunit (family B)
MVEFFNGKYDDKNQRITFIVKEQDRKKKLEISMLNAYFYIHEKDHPKAYSVIQEAIQSKKIKSIDKEGLFFKIILERYFSPRYSELIQELNARGVMTYEADLNPMKLFLLDKKIDFPDKMDFLYFDIETDDSGPIDMKKYPILSIAWYSSRDKQYGFLAGADEGKMLSDFMKIMYQHDVLIGWNSSEFDIPYLKERMMQKKLYFNWQFIHSIDLMYEFKDNFRSGISSYSLDSISNKFLGENKVERTKSIKQMFMEDLQKLKEYNQHDVELLVKLEQKFGLVQLKILICKKAGVFLSDGYRSQIIDFLLLRKARKQHVHFKSLHEANVGDEKIIGGLIQDAEKGYYKDMAILDFKSLYPSIIISFNISPETLRHTKSFECIRALNSINEDGELVDGKEVYFNNFSKGIVPELCEEMLQERQTFKKLKQEAGDDLELRDIYQKKENIVKVITNAIYGQFPNPRCRYYDADLSNAITGAGRYISKQVKNFLKAEGYTVKGGHTDSMFVVIQEDKIPEILERVHAYLAILLAGLGVKNNQIKLALDSVFKKYIYVETSRYVGLKENREWKVAGLEMINSSSIPYLKKVQKQLIEKIFADASLIEMKAFIDKTKTEVFSGALKVEDLSISKRLNKMPEEYAKTKPLHAVAATMLQATGEKLYYGQKINYIITNFDAKQDRVVPIEMYSGKYDKQYYWESQIFNPLARILSVVYPKENWDSYVKQENVQSSLQAFVTAQDSA